MAMQRRDFLRYALVAAATGRLSGSAIIAPEEPKPAEYSKALFTNLKRLNTLDDELLQQHGTRRKESKTRPPFYSVEGPLYDVDAGVMPGRQGGILMIHEVRAKEQPLADLVRPGMQSLLNMYSESPYAFLDIGANGQLDGIWWPDDASPVIFARDRSEASIRRGGHSDRIIRQQMENYALAQMQARRLYTGLLPLAAHAAGNALQAYDRHLLTRG